MLPLANVLKTGPDIELVFRLGHGSLGQLDKPLLKTQMTRQCLIFLYTYKCMN